MRNADFSGWFLTLVAIASNLDAIARAIAELESLKLDKTSQVIFSHSIDYKNYIFLFFVV
ncbi:hypothetical protein [Nostoc sp. DedQUE07]|uniref:hypothetical protein n=1 Tax=Nostoc sp. DedQUE07 TaxID=3075392 RepID=UPI002AD32753|nr:hypothetical protein [Nostoc sp. DedQUE07]MDZ8129368.1 hypothetical protein [Nostoc sp. DedQUE07]